MEINVKKIKFLATPEERARRDERQHALDAQYGNPIHELQGMYSATRWGKWAFQAITLISTAAFIFRVSFSHAAEFLGHTLATAICGTISVLAAYSVERMLEGNQVPFWKKLFVTKRFDVVLFLLAFFFSAIVIGGAYSGMMVVADNGNAPTLTETTSLHGSMQKSLDAKDNEIRKIQSCQIKGGYCWKGNLTEKGHARIAALQAEKEALLASMQSTNAVTSSVNTSKVETHQEKTAKAQHYLGMLALGSEAIKFIIFIFWGYRSLEISRFQRKGTYMTEDEDDDEIIEDETYDMYQEEEVGNSLPPTAGGANQIDPVYQANLKEHTSAMNYRRVLATRFSEHKRIGKHDIETLKGQWNRNEDRIARISAQLKQAYIRLPFPS